jgi:hypothetical protein
MPSDEFRFLCGHFKVAHRRLTQRLVGSNDWTTFETELWGYPVMGGAAFVDEMYGKMDDEEFWGLTLRLYDPTSDEWSLHWADTWHPGLCPPLRGSFGGGRGEFFGPQDEDGVSVLARFKWSEISESGALWEQAFSTDEGATWETNWTMRFERISGSSQLEPKREF